MTTGIDRVKVLDRYGQTEVARQQVAMIWVQKLVQRIKGQIYGRISGNAFSSSFIFGFFALMVSFHGPFCPFACCVSFSLTTYRSSRMKVYTMLCMSQTEGGVGSVSEMVELVGQV